MPQNQVQPTIIILKWPVPSQGNGHCYIIVRFCFFLIFVFLMCPSSFIFDAFPSVLVCNSDLFVSNSGILLLPLFKTIEIVFLNRLKKAIIILKVVISEANRGILNYQFVSEVKKIWKLEPWCADCMQNSKTDLLSNCQTFFICLLAQASNPKLKHKLENHIISFLLL